MWLGRQLSHGLSHRRFRTIDDLHYLLRWEHQHLDHIEPTTGALHLNQLLEVPRGRVESCSLRSCLGVWLSNETLNILNLDVSIHLRRGCNRPQGRKDGMRLGHLFDSLPNSSSSSGSSSPCRPSLMRCAFDPLQDVS